MNLDALFILLGSITAVIGSILAARYAARAAVKTKVLDVEALAYQRADAMNAAAFERLNNELNSLRTDRDADRTRLGLIEKEVRAVRNHNNQLITFVYKLVSIIRNHGLLGEIDPEDVAEGIYL